MKIPYWYGYAGWLHTLCPHLAMRGAPARAIQELAGYQDLSTTQRDMHLSPAAVENAIRLLETPITGGIHLTHPARADHSGDFVSANYPIRASCGRWAAKC